MLTKQQKFRFSILITALLAVLVIWWPAHPSKAATACQCLSVSFLDVGQGDAIFIETPEGIQVLIDGGRDATVLRELAEQMPIFDREIDMVIATHPDMDHIAGLVSVLERYTIGTILMTTNEGDSAAAQAFARAVTEEPADKILADAGQIFRIGADTYIQVFAPTGDESKLESNAASIVTRVVFGDTSFMLSGDAPLEIEDYLVRMYGQQLDSDVLKLGHHGSKTSTSELWLDTVTPEYAVVSAGIDNSYGHPHQEVMQRVFNRNIETSHTGTDGTVTFLSDGESVWRK